MNNKTCLLCAADWVNGSDNRQQGGYGVELHMKRSNDAKEGPCTPGTGIRAEAQLRHRCNGSGTDWQSTVTGDKAQSGSPGSSIKHIESPNMQPRLNHINVSQCVLCRQAQVEAAEAQCLSVFRLNT